MHSSLRWLPLLLIAALAGCISSTPFQSARVTEPGESGDILSFQRSAPGEDDDWGWYQAEFSNRLAFDGRSDLGLNVGLIWLDDDDEHVGMLLGADWKVELISDRLSVQLPFRVFPLGDVTTGTSHIYPRAILTQPLADGLDLNLSATRFYYLSDGRSGVTGFGAGLGIRVADSLSLLPEVGVMEDWDGDTIVQFGLGVQLTGRAVMTPKPELMPTPR